MRRGRGTPPRLDHDRNPPPFRPPTLRRFASEVRRMGDESIELLRARPTKNNPEGALRNITANACTILALDEQWAEVLAFDEFAETLVTRKPPPWRPNDAPAEVKCGDWTDEDTIRAQSWLAEHYALDIGLESTLCAIKVAAHRRRVHPVRDWLRSLRWDGKRRGPTWLVDVFGAEGTPYTRAVGQAFLVACVARVMVPGCKVDTVPILEGEQGIGKSSCLRALVGDDWFLEMSISDVTNVDAMQVLRRKWIAEMPEIDGWSRSETSHFKGYVSRQVDTYRASYGRGTRDYPRQTCFIGTTNGQEYLKDETGNRRFQPVTCTKGDVAAVRQLREQLWAEAVARYDAHEEWHISDPELLDAFKVEQDARYRSDPWEQAVSGWLAKPADAGFPNRGERGVTTADALCGALVMDRGKLTQTDSNRMAAVLRRLGWAQGKQERRDGARVRPFRPTNGHDHANGAAYVPIPLEHPELDEPEPEFDYGEPPA